LVVLAINLSEKRDVVAAFVKGRGVTTTVLLDANKEAEKSYQIAYTPTVFLVDRQGKLVGKAIGERQWAGGQGLALLRRVLARPSGRGRRGGPPASLSADRSACSSARAAADSGRGRGWITSRLREIGSASAISIAMRLRRRSSRPTARCGRNASPIPRSTIRFAVSIVSTSSATLGTSPARRDRPCLQGQSLEPRSKKISGRSAISARRARRVLAGQDAARPTSTSGSSRRLTVSTSGWWSDRARPISASPRSTISSTSFEWPERTVIITSLCALWNRLRTSGKR